jgi:integrase
MPSGRYQASYRGPDNRRHFAPTTYTLKMDAEQWLVDERRVVAAGAWTPPKARAEAALRPAAGPVTFGEYAGAWLEHRSLKPRTREHYRQLLNDHLVPTFGPLPLSGITPALVRVWHSGMDTRTPTVRAHAYGLLRTIMGGAGNTRRVHKVEPLTLAQLETLVSHMPERYRPLTLLAAWCGLRFGELTELRRKDVDLDAGVIRVRRAVVRTGGGFVVTTPKSEAGVRDVAIPPHLLPALRAHLSSHVTGGKDALLFPAAGDPGRHLAPASLYRVFYPAREAAGRPDARWHDLRHTGAVLAAQTGATLAELMGRLGHSTPAAALRYQHAAQGRDAQIAAALSKLAEARA